MQNVLNINPLAHLLSVTLQLELANQSEFTTTQEFVERVVSLSLDLGCQSGNPMGTDP